MIEFDEAIQGVWFVAMRPVAQADFMAAIRKLDVDKYEVKYRFRYYKEHTGDPFNDRDEKRWYQGVLNAPLEKIVSVMREMTRKLPGDNHYELLRGDATLADFITRFGKMPFVYARDATPEESAEFKKDKEGHAE